MGHPRRAGRHPLPRARLRGLHRPRRRRAQLLRARDQRARHRVRPLPAAALQSQGQGQRGVGHGGAALGCGPRRHAERPVRRGPWVDRRNRDTVVGAETPGGRGRAWLPSRPAGMHPVPPPVPATSGESTSRGCSGPSRSCREGTAGRGSRAAGTATPSTTGCGRRREKSTCTSPRCGGSCASTRDRADETQGLSYGRPGRPQRWAPFPAASAAPDRNQLSRSGPG